jgi:hypothetical protein
MKIMLLVVQFFLLKQLHRWMCVKNVCDFCKMLYITIIYIELWQLLDYYICRDFIFKRDENEKIWFFQYVLFTRQNSISLKQMCTETECQLYEKVRRENVLFCKVE